jgi:DNA-binding NarL/FixJ family response regulator
MGHADEVYVTGALRAGAHGYLLKDSAGRDLLRAVTALAQHKSFFSPAVSRVMLDDYVRQLAETGHTSETAP